MNTDLYLKENTLRKEARRREYNPVNGEGGCGTRLRVATGFEEMPVAFIPETMADDPLYPTVRKDFGAWRRLRVRHDFEYWAVEAVRIKDKVSGRIIPFTLNSPQRKVLGVLEAQRLAGKPMRIIMLKARQWGGSTFVQMYMAWIQSVHRHNWHSLICAHVRDAAATIKGMYTRMLANYPPHMWEGEDGKDGDSSQPKFRPFERSQNIFEITGRGCCVTLGTSENPEAVRSGDYAMAHLSEAAFWGDTSRKNPDDFIRAVCSGIALEPLTLVAVESTANGVGNWFHREWLRAEKGESDKTPVFVPWYEIDIYTLPLPQNPAEYIEEMSDYEKGLWKSVPDITLEQLYWYHCKRREYASAAKMHAEFPSNPTEAFTATGRGVFDPAHIDRLRAGCVSPDKMDTGEPADMGSGFTRDSTGRFRVAEHPGSAMLHRYVVGVDVGGRSESADYSVIVVFDRLPLADGGPIKVVAQWRGHCDYDILARKAIAIARYYRDALLVVESNTFEHNDASPGGMGVLSLISREYANVYRRRSSGNEGFDGGMRVGFHTNRATKLALVARMQTYVREGLYKEAFSEAADELASYEEPVAGVFAARPGCHDDMVMARGIAIYVAHDLPAPMTADIPEMTPMW